MTLVTPLSRPRYSRWFGLRHLEADRLADDLLERLEVPGRRPDLEFSVTPAVELNDDVFTPVVDFQTRDRLRVAAVQTLGDAED